MRYPHVLLIGDIRNRFPRDPSVNYEAFRYDYLRLIAEGNERSVDFLNTHHAEPDDSKNIIDYPEVIVPALVTMLNDGDRNKSETVFVIRIPISFYRLIKKEFKEKRRNSLANYGYLDRQQETIYTYSGLPGLVGIFGEQTIGSSFLSKEVPVYELTIRPSPQHPNPFSDRLIKGRFNYQANEKGTTGFLPPMRGFSATESSKFNSFIPVVRKFADMGTGYPLWLPISRVDTYFDMVEFRCSEPLTYL